MRSRAQRSSTLTENLHYCRNRSEMSITVAPLRRLTRQDVHGGGASAPNDLSIQRLGRAAWIKCGPAHAAATGRTESPTLS